MRNILLALAAILPLFSLSQEIYMGQILSIVDSTPIRSSSIKINNKQVIQPDSNGVFTFSTFKRKVRLMIEPSTIHRVDTIVLLRSSETLIKLYISFPIDSALASFDIRNNRAILFCGGGYAPLAPLPSDKSFEKNYSVKYLILDCLVPSSQSLDSYNKTIADYLDKKYGNEWRQKVRPDVFYVTKKIGK